MTQKEFFDRVEVEVSAKEFEAINEVYMNSDLDKDEFCRMWKKMNKTRVHAARCEVARLRELQTLKEIAWTMYQRISGMENTHLRLAQATLCRQEKNFLYGIGVEVTDSMNLTTVWYKLAQYLGIVK